MFSRITVAALLIALGVLAALQYRWITQISITERQRLERTVRESSMRFAADFAGEISSIATFLQLFEGPGDAGPIVSRYRNWMDFAAHPDVVESLSLIRRRADSGLELLEIQGEQLAPVPWPPDLAGLSESLARGDPPASAMPAGDSLSVLIPIMRPFEQPAGSALESWLLVTLDRHVIVDQLLPDLAVRHFSSDASLEGIRSYRLAVIALAGSAAPIFTAGGEWTPDDLATPDYAVELMSPFDLAPRGGPPGGRRGGGPPPGPGGRPRGMRQLGFPGIVSVLPIGADWRLLVKHEAGSLETAVDDLKERNLAISFGILVILGLAAVAATISGQRAQALGRMQMEFAAGISHELRTPLSVIQGAAHNLGAGLVSGKEGIEQYAAIVKKEARRLSDMVDQVMAYMETQSGRRRYDIALLDVNDVVDRATQSVSAMLDEGRGMIATRIDPDLPPVMADANALSQCLQNLLSNAAKYGRQDGAARIEVEGRLHGESHTVRLSVTDQGPGVPEGDVSHLFDAFHRGSNASSNIPGNGLGLYLVRRMMEAQHGAVLYERPQEGGARFTLVIPVAKPAV